MAEYQSDWLFGARTGNGGVLVVDDEPNIRRLVRLMLGKAGDEVLEAEDGQAAIDTMKAGENRLMFDAVLCDMRRPKINGGEAIAYVFRDNFLHVSVVVLTGVPDTHMAVSCMRRGYLSGWETPSGCGRARSPWNDATRPGGEKSAMLAQRTRYALV